MATDKKKHVAKSRKKANENKALKSSGDKPAATKKIVLTREQSAKLKSKEDDKQ